jgi:HPr kinase/phosphorylase
MTATTVHASAVRTGDIGILIRGPSGSGKSRLAFELMLAGRAGRVPPTQLIGDDRLVLHVEEGRLYAQPAPELEGLIEIRGLGIRRCDFVAQALVSLVVDLSAPDAGRMPEQESFCIPLCGINIPRIPVGAGFDAVPLVAAALLTRPLDASSPAAFRRLSEGEW